MGVGPHPELAELSAVDLGRLLRRGEITSVELARMSLERIAALDFEKLRSVIEVNPDALDIAARLDRERRSGRARGPLHGLPVVVKDNIDTGDRMLTSAGSLAMTAAPAVRDASLVSAMRRAGLLLLGKANLSEWANFRSSRSSSGWSGRGRQTRNPYVLDRSPGGSSSGSGVVAAAGFAALSVGTETDGSITSPAAANGVVGLKPGVGVVDQSGIVPISFSQDAAGPMARTVTDAALLLGAMVTRPADYTRNLRKTALQGRRLGVLRKPYTGYSEHTDRVYEDSLRALKELGAVLVEVEIANTEELRTPPTAEYIVLKYEFKHGLNRYLKHRRGLPVRTLSDLIRWNRDHADVEMPYFQQEIFEQAEATTGLRAREYREARARALQLMRVDGIDRLLREHNLDALVAPGRAPAWTIDEIDGDRGLGGSSQPSAVAGYPIISVPAGWAHELPLALVFFAGPGSESRLLGFAYAFEQLVQMRRPPRFLPTLQLP